MSRVLPKGTRLNNITALMHPPHPEQLCVPLTPTPALPRASLVNSNNADRLIFDSIVAPDTKTQCCAA